MRKPDSRARVRANGLTGPSGGTAAFRGSVRRDGQVINYDLSSLWLLKEL